jgi:His-Xaa-Ser system protein HxsD
MAVEESPSRQGGFLLSVDELGEAATVSVDRALFENAAIFKTAYWATNMAYLFLTSGPDNSILVEVRAKTVAEGEAERLAREFCNALVDQQTRQIVLKETLPVRDALLTKAFGAGHSHLDPSRIS